MNPPAFPTAPTAPATGKREPKPEAEAEAKTLRCLTSITNPQGGIISWPTGGKVGWPLTIVPKRRADRLGSIAHRAQTTSGPRGIESASCPTPPRPPLTQTPSYPPHPTTPPHHTPTTP